MVLCRKKIPALPYSPILVRSLLQVVSKIFSLEYMALQADAFKFLPCIQGLDGDVKTIKGR